MKRIAILFVMSFIVCVNACAQIVTPDTGARYTFETLAASYPDAVQYSQSGTFDIFQDITISDSDTLVFSSTDQQLLFHNDLQLAIAGSLLCEPRSDSLRVSSVLDSSGATPYEFRFEGAQSCILENILFENGKDIFISESDITIRYCEFVGFQDAAVRVMNCSPLITECYFHDNLASAINSPANANASPQIVSNRFYNNVLLNANTPQINLGTGAETPILIQNNHIEGVASSMSGGIAVSSLMGGSDVTTVQVSGNFILHNRYGYTQTGTNIRGTIVDNDILDNNLETDPMNGGSGVSIYGYDTTCYAYLRRNIIAGNLWGVTAIYKYQIDMGTQSCPGGNVLYDNGNGGVDYAFAMSQYSTLDVSAVGNYWGSNDAEFAESTILHKTDNASLGQVFYEPILQLHPIAYSAYIDEGYPYEVAYFSDTNIAIVDILDLPDVDTEILLNVSRGVRYEIVSDEDVEGLGYQWDGNEIVRDIRYRVYTPHGDTAYYTVSVAHILCSVPELSLPTIATQLYPNPVAGDSFTIEGMAEEAMQVEVFDLSGRCVWRATGGTGSQTVPTANWKSGLYVVRITQRGETVSHRVVIP